MPNPRRQTIRSVLLAGALSLLLPADISALMAHETAPAAGHAPQPSIIQKAALPHDMEMIALRLHVPPGGASPAHRHAGTLFVYVLSGAVHSGLNGESPVLFKAGDHWTEPEGTHHSHFENASQSDPAELLVVFAAPEGATLTTPDQ